MLPADIARRRAEFEALFMSIPDTNKYRVKRVCEVLFCSPQTVRTWRCPSSPRACPDSKLKILRRALAGE